MQIFKTCFRKTPLHVRASIRVHQTQAGWRTWPQSTFSVMSQNRSALVLFSVVAKNKLLQLSLNSSQVIQGQDKSGQPEKEKKKRNRYYRAVCAVCMGGTVAKILTMFWHSGLFLENKKSKVKICDRIISLEHTCFLLADWPLLYQKVLQQGYFVQYKW